MDLFKKIKLKFEEVNFSTDYSILPEKWKVKDDFEAFFVHPNAASLDGIVLDKPLIFLTKKDYRLIFHELGHYVGTILNRRSIAYLKTAKSNKNYTYNSNKYDNYEEAVAEFTAHFLLSHFGKDDENNLTQTLFYIEDLKLNKRDKMKAQKEALKASKYIIERLK